MRLIILLLLFFPSVIAQNEGSLRIGEWQSYFAFNNCSEIIETDQNYIGKTKYGLIFIEKEDFSIHTMTKINGLSDYHISAIHYNQIHQSLIIGYSNGNIDILKKGKVKNINDLKIKQLDGSKTINYFLSDGERIFCATDFGILVINIEKNEVEATYYIGDNASNLVVNQLAMNNGYIYAATDKGIKRALLSDPQIQIFLAWQTISSDISNYTSIASFNNGIIAARGNKGETCSLIYFEDLNENNFANVSNFRNLRVYNNQIFATRTNAVNIYNSTFNLSSSISSPTINQTSIKANFSDVVFDSSDQLWIADETSGILSINLSSNTWLQFLPHGPYSNNAHKLKVIDDNLWIIPGGLTQPWNNRMIAATISIKTNTGWLHMTSTNSPLLKGATDLLSISQNPQNPNNIFISSWGSGLFEINFTNNQAVVENHFFIVENGLQNIFDNQKRYVRVATTAFDNNNVLWMTNSSVINNLVAYFPENNTWKQYSYETLNNQMGIAPILATSWGHKWVPIFRGSQRGIFIWDDNNTPADESDDRYRGPIPRNQETDKRNQGQILLWNEQGEEITDRIYALAEDKNGYIWLGTDKGAIIQYQAATIFTKEKPVFSRLLVARGDGTTAADYLLGDEIIGSIAVDPGNRKWLGTQGAGAFLVSADGNKQINAFNTNNSPLPSNYINDIAINEKTGEVFFATSEGIVSFKGSAIEGSNSFSDMYVYPNPVRPDFSGNITITGLMTQTNVKITDISGKLVYQTTSIGGQASWNGKNLWGETVKSGIYLIFVASDDGNHSAVTKVAIVR